MWWKREILVFLFLFTLLLHQGSSSNIIEKKHTCRPSSCGEISNIRYPFRLEDDPIHCGDSRYELSCENNVPILNLYSGKYYVQAINYNNFTIRVVDPGVQQDDCSSLPRYFLSGFDFCDTYAMGKEICTDPYRAKQNLYLDDELLFKYIVYLNCSHQVTNNHKYVNTSSCLNSNSKGYYIYAMAGDLIIQDLQVGCHVKLVAPTSWLGLERKHVISYNEMHKALVYGFEISWLRPICQNRCDDSRICTFNTSNEILQCIRPYCYIMGVESRTACYGTWPRIISYAKDTMTAIWKGEFFNLSA
ncbi:LEAF RUST 10 DISEASE-RESISTANCE LOCUS RECEPTOR-LIKE PROTEIN KINASE 2.1 [Trifolium repens]|nr:LEAF RUST 10 DISEASE-RESISTANCE LOCUS RECEPTOR-LIKE PROTEIN KINASE 2.1 [Trifolium repens]